MKLVGFVGKSGTGKSHYALRLAEDLGVDCIIDDGVMIYRGLLRAGYSAKLETSTLNAVRRAIFTDDLHSQQVRTALLEYQPEKCLVLGTSKRMIEKICTQLELPFAEIVWVSIEDVLTPQDIAYASEMRANGMHAIPIVNVQLQHANSFVSYVQQMLHRVSVHSVKDSRIAPTVVRPMFSHGAIYIHPRVVSLSIDRFLTEYTHPFRLKKMTSKQSETGRFELKVHALWQENLIGNARALQTALVDYLRHHMGFPYPHVDIQLVSISPPRTDEDFPS